MKLSLAFLFISILAVGLAAGQNAGRNSAMSTQGQQLTNGPVAEYVSDSNCTIGWSSQASGTMSVRYGTDRTKLTQTAEAMESKDGRNYHARVNGLAPNTRYYFQVVNGGEAVSGIGTFQTVAQGDAPIKSKATVPQ